MSCRRTGATIVFSSSRAEAFSLLTWMVICGMSMSGRSDTGSEKYVTSPTMKQAVNAMSTAIGLCIRNFTMSVVFFRIHVIACQMKWQSRP